MAASRLAKLWCSLMVSDIGASMLRVLPCALNNALPATDIIRVRVVHKGMRVQGLWMDAEQEAFPLTLSSSPQDHNQGE